MPEHRALVEMGLGFAGTIGEVASELMRWVHGGERRREQLVDALGDVAYWWARICSLTGVAPAMLLARSRAHVEWRLAGRAAGGPAAAPAGTTLEEFAVWAVERGGGAVDAHDDQALGEIGLALVGDAGEVVECLRKLAREGDAVRERLAGELGDVWRYWSRLCAASGSPPADVLARSRARMEGVSTARP